MARRPMRLRRRSISLGRSARRCWWRGSRASSGRSGGLWRRLRFGGRMSAFRSVVWILFLLLTVVLSLSPFGVILLPALAGGLVVAAVLMWRGPRARSTPRYDPFGPDVASTDIINMSR